MSGGVSCKYLPSDEQLLAPFFGRQMEGVHASKSFLGQGMAWVIVHVPSIVVASLTPTFGRYMEGMQLP